MKKQKNKIIYYIIFSLFLSITFVSPTKAFLDSDLWLNLYKDLDEWLAEFEDTQYVYELSGQDKKDIAKNINSILESEDIWNCLEDWINETLVSEIASWNVESLTKNIKEECKNKDWSINSKKIWNIISKVSEIKTYYNNRAETKADSIHKISRIWMYADWTIKNSPFDIISDLQDIDKIIFTQNTDYNTEDIEFLSDYKHNPFISPLFNNLEDILENDEEDKNWNEDEEDNQIDNWRIEDEENEDENLEEKEYIDWNNYTCSNNDSWLWDDSFNILKDSLDWAWEDYWFWFKYSGSWYIKIDGSNKINIPDLDWNKGWWIVPSLSLLWTWSYSRINDNAWWRCSQFFCIVIDFVVNKHSLLDYGTSPSIEKILEISNNHLKKAVNTSLVQSKMTTNNFEMSLRDLNLPEMFHLWIIITKKTPPILYLDNITQKKEKKNKEENESSDYVKNSLRKKFELFSLNYDEQNNVEKFRYRDEELKTIIKSLENFSVRAWHLHNEHYSNINLKSKIINISEEEVSKDINNNLLKDFNKEFTELEQFTKTIMEYSDNIDILIRNLKKIKTYSW